MGTREAINRLGVRLVLLLGVVFVAVGAGILSGYLLPKSAFVGEGLRTIIGIVLIGYGIVRAAMAYRKLTLFKSEGNDG